MELFYRHVLRYEDGEGVFEWGAGGIMHLHSINFGSQMPRVDPEAIGLRVADRQHADLGAAFARVHEEYLTDWSLGKAEKWFFRPIDDAPARKRENVSPLHTDSESDGSETDEEIVKANCFAAWGCKVPEGVDAVDARVSAVGPLAADEDYVRLFPSPTEMVYEQTAAGGRKVVVLTEAQRRCLERLNQKLEGKELQRGALVEACSVSVPATALSGVPVSGTVSRSVPMPATSRGEVEGRSSSVPVPATSDPWHPCQITVEEKKLLMTNNCQLVRWARRKWYRRLTETCNMHDRHGGAGLEVAPVWVDAEDDEEETQAASTRTLGGRLDVKILTQNMRQLDPDVSFWEGLEAVQGCDALCLQEVTPSCARLLSAEARSRGYEVFSPMFRGRCSAEGFDVAMLLKCEVFRRLRVCVVELGPSERCLLHAVVEVKRNGALLAIGTVHLTAARAEHATRAAELSVALRALEELPVDGCIVAGDVNMHNQETTLPVDLNAWRDAWVECGAVEGSSGTWCPDEMDLEDAAVRQWRFDRVYFLSKKTVSVEAVREVSGASVPTSLEAVNVEGCSSESAAVAEGELLDASVPTIEEPKMEVSKSGALFSEGVGGVSLPTSAGAPGGELGASVPTAAAAPALGQTLTCGSFQRAWMFDGMDHALVAVEFGIVGGAVLTKVLGEERVKVLQAGIGSAVARRPGAKESCVRKQGQAVYCGKDYEKPRMLPGRGCILEDPRRKTLFRLYTRRNCHRMNTHDPLKAMGLVANVDDQAVLTVQAAVNYLTKYMGKIGGGHTASGRIGDLIDDIISKMQDTESMTVASLLSKLFIHAAVPDEICSLEAWHVLFDLPRVLASRYIDTISAKDATVFKGLNEIESATQEQKATKPRKVQIYLERNACSRGRGLSAARLRGMSYSQFMSGVERRGKTLTLRSKSKIVKEKPYLQLDAQRRDAVQMARACLRLHRPFDTEEEDPNHLGEADALEQLRAFIDSEACPVWLRQRYAKHNRRKRKKVAQGASPHDSSAVPSAVSGEGGSGVTLPSAAERVGDVEPSAKRVRLQVNAASILPDTRENRVAVAREHGLLWFAETGNVDDYSISEACRQHTTKPGVRRIRAYLGALLDTEVTQKMKLVELMEKYVYTVLVVDLQPYQKRGGGVQKSCLPKRCLLNLEKAYFHHQGSAGAQKKKQMSGAKYAVLWNFLKGVTLQECGLLVSEDRLARIGFSPEANLQAEEHTGEWRKAVRCTALHKRDPEEWEAAAEREAKRVRYVKYGFQEQSMGPPGKTSLYEVGLPYDGDALMCVDKETSAEWDALNPFLRYFEAKTVCQELREQLAENVEKWVLEPVQGGISHVEAGALLAAGSAGAEREAGYAELDPTQATFVDHMCRWCDEYHRAPERAAANLPPLVCADGEGAGGGPPRVFADSGGANASSPVRADGEREMAQLLEPILLLGTAGTGKTTTIQAANAILREKFVGPPGRERIVRAAFTGVAASNMGAGGRTLMSLFRLSKHAQGGVLPPMSKEEVDAMDEELGEMAVLEIDELSMLEKSVLAHVHQRLQQWRYEKYHPQHCRDRDRCHCGARMLFGGVKVVLAGDFGQLPPVAVPQERTLLHGKSLVGGQSRADVNVGLRIFQGIRNVIRLRRIHRQAGQSIYKESLLRLRDLAHTKEDVDMWRSHDLTSPKCCLSPAERLEFEVRRVHLFCENKRAGEFNGQRLGEEVAKKADGHIVRIWSVDSSPAVERQTCDRFGGLRRVLHVAEGAPVMLTTNLRTVWNLVNGLRGRVVAVLGEPAPASAGGAASACAGGAAVKRNATEVGGFSVSAIEYIVVEFPGYMGPPMVAGQPKWVCVPRQTMRHEKFKHLSRRQFPLVLSYGMTVHKSQGLTLKEGCVFNMEHDPKWNPFKNMCGLAFVGMSRTTDFASMAFKYVPDYWVFRSAAETDMFRWRESLEARLDDLHDALAAKIYNGRNSVGEDVARHVEWSERRLNGRVSEVDRKDIEVMLSVRGVLAWPKYDDKPARRQPASTQGGGRDRRKTMRPGPMDKRERADLRGGADEEIDPREEEFRAQAKREEEFDALLEQMHCDENDRWELELLREMRGENYSEEEFGP